MFKRIIQQGEKVRNQITAWDRVKFFSAKRLDLSLVELCDAHICADGMEDY